VVELKRRRFGLDINGHGMTLASRSLEAGLNVVDMIETVAEDSLAERLSSHEGDLYFSIGEDNALIKRISQPYEHGLDETAVARFEFVSSLLDGPDNYFIDVHETGAAKTKLAVGYNKSRVDEIIDRLSNTIEKPTGFRLRSLALAQAYVTLCKTEGGRLVCLLDINAESCTYCFVCDKAPVLPGALKFAPVNGGQGASWETGLLDLAATVQYQLAALAKSGLTDPLSRLIVSGTRADEPTLTRLEKLLRVGAGKPQPIKSYFKDELHTKAPEAMVALGLTVG